VHYEGTLVDGTKFDSSWDRGEPATFPLARLVKAWQLAIPQAGVGDTIEIAVPADLGYGPRGKGPIPGNATLLFRIELLAIAGRA
jgi:FKBP-type peptidyl-prolyl cis-trans isomerase FkpA